MRVGVGRGYVSADRNKRPEDPIGVITVDSLFSPVIKVNYTVEAARLAQRIDFDKLVLEVWTDGTVDGQTAVSLAAEIVREQMYPFQLLGRPEAAEEPMRTAEIAPFEGYDMPIEQLDLSVRAYNCLKRSGLMTVGAVLEKSEEELLALRNFGEKSYFELKDKLVGSGFPAPRVESRRGAAEPEAPAASTTATAAPTREDPEVGALGAALMEALKEAGRDKE